MSVIQRSFTNQKGYSDDFHKVREFIARINEDKVVNHHYLWGRWEWGFTLSNQDTTHLDKIGVWEDDGKIVGLATYEDKMGTTYFCLDPAYNMLKKEMLDYCIKHMMVKGKNKILIDNNDREFGKYARKAGFKPIQWYEENSIIDIVEDHLTYELPEGYHIISFDEVYDVKKHNACLWHGFNHEGEPPITEEDLEDRKRQANAPHMDKSLLIAVVAPNGDYVSYCGMWYTPNETYALVEPVATHPDYRKMGLGKAAVLEGVKRCGRQGAKVAYVGSNQQFYYNIGFNPVSTGTMWEIEIT